MDLGRVGWGEFTPAGDCTNAPAAVPAPAGNPLAAAAIRVAAFVDGFNLYHALRDLKLDHLKTWQPDSYRRHREYVRALQAIGVKVVMGRFKGEDRRC
jgi:hypothetical protein